MAITLDGTTGTTTPNVVLPGSASGTITLAAPSAAGTQSYTLPTGVPAANGYALTSTTAGVMSWAATGAAATTTALGTVYGSMAASNQTTAIGYQAAFTTPTVINGVAVGYQAGYAVTGSGNTLIGTAAGNDTVVLTTGTNNIILGGYGRTSSAAAVNQIVIGYNMTGQADSNVTIGSGSGKIYNAFTVNATWTQTSDSRLKTNVQNDSLGLSFINRLRPVTFNWKPSNEIDPSLPYYKETNERDTTTVIHGLIAQEVKAALDAEGCSTFNGWDAGNEDTIQAISREMFISPLIKAIQELTARVAALEAK